jgi:hypothetical protein
MCKNNGETTYHLLFHCAYVYELWSMLFCLFGLCPRGLWICWLVGQGVLEKLLSLRSGGPFLYVSCRPFGENETSVLLKGLSVHLWS